MAASTTVKTTFHAEGKVRATGAPMRARIRAASREAAIRIANSRGMMVQHLEVQSSRAAALVAPEHDRPRALRASRRKEIGSILALGALLLAAIGYFTKAGADEPIPFNVIETTMRCSDGVLVIVTDGFRRLSASERSRLASAVRTAEGLGARSSVLFVDNGTGQQFGSY